jgi:hypothetical protein
MPTRSSVSGQGLSGTIPTQMGLYSTTLDQGVAFHDNAISGTVPTELGELTGLPMLALQGNSISGSLPTQLAKLSVSLCWLTNTQYNAPPDTNIFSCPINAAALPSACQLRSDYCSSPPPSPLLPPTSNFTLCSLSNQQACCGPVETCSWTTPNCGAAFGSSGSDSANLCNGSNGSSYSGTVLSVAKSGIRGTIPTQIGRLDKHFKKLCAHAPLPPPAFSPLERPAPLPLVYSELSISSLGSWRFIVVALSHLIYAGTSSTTKSRGHFLQRLVSPRH